MIKFALDGVEQAIAAVRNIGAAVTDDTIKPEAMKALEPVAETARMLVPVLSGDLRESIVVSDHLQSAPARGGRGSAGVYVGVLAGQAFHGWFVEAGTVKMAAQPFLAPAFEQHRDEIVDILGKGAGRLILQAN
jgi:HK97 gp10 family phage protein